MTKLSDTLFLLRPQADSAWSRRKQAAYWLWRVLLLLGAGACMGYLLLRFAYGQYHWGTFTGYRASPELMALNLLPVMWLCLLGWALTGRVWLGFLLGGGLSFFGGAAHFYKLCFRDDPLYFEDILIIREAGAMTTEQNYALFPDGRVLLAAAGLVLGAAALALLCRGAARGWKKRLALVLAAAVTGAGLFALCLDEERYAAVENYDHLNRWSPTQNYIAHGFVYPFLHSINEFVETPPEGYSRRGAEALLADYGDADIPDGKKVSVIALMREAYVDFSLFDIPGLDTSGYDAYHRLQEESYSGSLLTNIFAGGTIDSERGFLTGNYKLKNFRSDANSYLWYLREQGYTVEGSHPYYRWFYNRYNVNGYLGFEDYRFLEEDYEHLTDAYLPEDSILYPEVYRDFTENKATGKPYFSFVLNVESHGPYATEEYTGERTWLTGDYSQACKNAMNNYMNSIMTGDRELMKLVEQLRQDPDPVVLILFSDHLPWMGDGNIFYQELGLDIDAGTEQGFRSRYTTDYLIWANDAAKAQLGTDMVGDGPTVSPCYLMDLAFEQMGWTGPAFMQAMRELRQVFPVVTVHGRYVIDGVFTGDVPPEREAQFRDFQYLQHYWRNEFLYE